MNEPNNETIIQLKKFIESSSACQEALSPLKKGVELAALLDKETEFCICRSASGFTVEQRPAKKFDVHFSVSTLAAEKLCDSDPSSVAEIAVTTLKQVKAQNIRISVPGNLFSLMKNGYLEIIAKGGKPMWHYLSDHGITNPAKVMGAIKEMIKNRS